ITADTLRNLRASLLYDTLAARLWPNLDDRVFQRYVRKRNERQARRVVRRYRAESPDQHAARAITQLDELMTTGQDLLEQLRSFTDRAPAHFIQVASKASYAALNLLSLGARVTLPVLLITLLLGAIRFWNAGALPQLAPLALRIALHPGYVAYAVVVAA